MCQVCIRHRHKVFIISPCIHQLMCVQGLGYTVMVGEILKLLIRHPSLAPDSLLYTYYVRGTFKGIISFTPHPGR